jgi:hypothetical protein
MSVESAVTPSPQVRKSVEAVVVLAGQVNRQLQEVASMQVGLVFHFRFQAQQLPMQSVAMVTLTEQQVSSLQEQMELETVEAPDLQAVQV